MPLLEATTLAIGTAIAKQMIKSWLGDTVPSAAAQAALGPIQKRLAELLGQRHEGDQIERVAQQVVENMQPLFELEARNLDEDERDVVVLETAETLAAADINARLLITYRLDPDKLADALIAGRPEASQLLSAGATVLYERLLRETSRDIIYIANNIDGYEPAFGYAVLFDLQQILENVARVLSARDEEAATYEKKYCAALQKQLNKFEQFGIEYADEAGRQQQLDVAYVPLSAEKLDIHDRDSDTDILQIKHRLPFDELHKSVPISGSIDSILPLSRRLIIRGQPGSGKSTLLRWLAIRATQQDFSQFNPDLADWDDCVPFFIQLRATVGKCFPNPQDWPTLHVKMLADDPPRQWVSKLLDNGRALVLIDGVDELPLAQRAGMLEDLQALIHSYPYARYIITSRPAAVKAWDEWLIWKERERFVTVSLQDMQQFPEVGVWYNQGQFS